MATDRTIMSYSATLDEKGMIKELAKRYDMTMSKVVVMLIRQDYERLQLEINGYVQTQLHPRSVEKRRSFSASVNSKVLEKGLHHINMVDLDDENDLICPLISGCQICLKRYITESFVNPYGRKDKRVIGVKR